MAKRSGLGKGLDALLKENQSKSGDDTQTLRLDDIVPNKDQPRKTFDPDALAELTESIKQHGVLQPLLVRPIPSGGYQLVAGERRWRAARAAGLSEVPVVIRDLSDSDAMQIAIIENLQREDLNPIEEAEGLQALVEKCGFTQDELAHSVSKSRPAITNSLRLLKLPAAVRDMVKDGKISAGHARALLALDDEGKIISAANDIVSHKLSVRDTERLVAAETKEQKKKTKSAPKAKDSYYKEVELALGEALGRRVRVYTARGKGTVEIEYYGKDDLKNIASKLGNLAD